MYIYVLLLFDALPWITCSTTIIYVYFVSFLAFILQFSSFCFFWWHVGRSMYTASVYTVHVYETHAYDEEENHTIE